MLTRRLTVCYAVLLLATVFLAACGSKPKPKHTLKLPPSVVRACPQALGGHGDMGEHGCAPNAAVQVQTLTRVHASSVSGGQGITYPDLSNNDPTYNLAAIKAHGHPAVVLKVNQGIGFLDSTFYYMAIAAKRAGICVGGYDFDQEYTAAEAYVFVNRLHAAGIFRNTPCTLPPTLDIEFGVPSWAGLEHQIAVLMREFGRVQIYTGAWYWGPHFGCTVPKGVDFWLSGYPTAPLLCGLSQQRFAVHQYTDHGYNGVFFSDMNVWRGSSASFTAWTHNAPAIASKAVKQRALYHLYRVRQAERASILHFRRLLARYRCYPPHRAQRGGRCERWKHEGAAAHKAGDGVVRQIKALKSALGI